MTLKSSALPPAGHGESLQDLATATSIEEIFPFLHLHTQAFELDNFHVALVPIGASSSKDRAIGDARSDPSRFLVSCLDVERAHVEARQFSPLFKSFKHCQCRAVRCGHCRLSVHGGPSIEHASEPDCHGIQSSEVLCCESEPGDFSKRSSRPSLGLQRLPLHQDGRQSHPALAARTRTGFSKSCVFSNGPWDRL